MKTVAEARRRWEHLFEYGDSTDDFKRAVKSEEQGNPCNDGLRSVCWKSFLLCDHLPRSEWSQRISALRDTYASLRDHFLRYINHPNDFDSSVDPLAEDEESPWQVLRSDEAMRTEIYQDVERCLQDIPFFREPSTKSKMLDILFIYSKLNPDIGYRQGMHELLAPVLWVVEEDAIDPQTSSEEENHGDDQLINQMLDVNYIEHDAFSLFCSIMQVARVYYEHSEQETVNGQPDVPPVVGRCQYIQNELLMVTDREVAVHLDAIEILPQIFLTRWIRLLFGREFPFEDVLAIWDFLFAEGLRIELVDYVCVAMILRIRWQLLESDYSGALGLLLRYPRPPSPPQTLVQDALYLEQQPNPARGAFLIAKYTGQPPKLPGGSPSRGDQSRSGSRNRSEENPLSGHSIPQRGLEALFQDVSEGLQRRTENWNVARAVRSAVSEARRNMAAAEPASLRARWSSSPRRLPMPSKIVPERVRRPEPPPPSRDRDNIVSTLSDALQDLRIVKQSSSQLPPVAVAALDRVYERVETAKLKLILETSASSSSSSLVHPVTNTTEEDKGGVTPPASGTSSVASEATPRAPPPIDRPDSPHPKSQSQPPPTHKPQRPTSTSSTMSTTRPSLSDPEFSWILGDTANRYRSPFNVSSRDGEDGDFQQSARDAGRRRGAAGRKNLSHGSLSSLFGDSRDDVRSDGSRDRGYDDDGDAVELLKRG